MNRQALARPWWLLPPGRLHPMWWVGITSLLLWADYLTGPKPQFPVVYVIPVTLAAWYSGRWPAVALAVAMPLVHVVLLVALWKQPGSMATLVATTTIRGAVIMAWRSGSHGSQSTSVNSTAMCRHWKDCYRSVPSVRVFGTSQANGCAWKHSFPSGLKPSSRMAFARRVGERTTLSLAMLLPID
jgi:hypothetical protein